MSSNVVTTPPTFTEFIGNALQVGGSYTVLSASSTQSGAFSANFDFNPNSFLSFEFSIPIFGALNFTFDLESTAQRLRFNFPQNNVLRYSVDSTILNNHVLSASLQSNTWHQMRIVSQSSNLVAVLNGNAYIMQVPNWTDPIVRQWANGTYRWAASNLGSPGTYQIRNIFAQSITAFQDPVLFNNSVTASNLNSDRIGCSLLRAQSATLSNAFASRYEIGDSSMSVFGSNQSIIFNTSNVERMRILPNGSVGINTPTPITRFDINGSSRVTGNFECMATTISNSLTASNIQSSGILTVPRINCGTNVNNCILALWGNNPPATSTSYFGFGINSSVLRYQVPNTANHTFFHENTELMRLNSAGNLGIGTSSPNERLVVIGNARVAGSLSCSNLTASNLGAFAFCNAIPYNLITNPPLSEYASAMSNGLLSSNDWIRFNASSNWNNVVGRPTLLSQFVNDLNPGSLSSSNDMTFSTGNPLVERLRVTSGGNFGIGTSNPAHRLDVDGNARVRGDLSVGPATSGTASVLRLNSSGANDTDGTIQFVNSGHFLGCSDDLTFGGVGSIGPNANGHRMYYRSTEHAFRGFITATSGIFLSGTTDASQTINFGYGFQNQEARAGQLAYSPQYAPGEFCMTGAGSTAFDRKIRLQDHVTIGSSLRIGSLAKISGFHVISHVLFSPWADEYRIENIDHNLGTVAYDVWVTVIDNTTPDCFTTKVTWKSQNTVQILVSRVPRMSDVFGTQVPPAINRNIAIQLLFLLWI